ncbi:MAG: helix-turn-helix domain-containing protein [Ruminococcaceae bacterium]|nr:helix-turn-helix domain-containing protein [Oscillospiraceae bacterium]
MSYRLLKNMLPVNDEEKKILDGDVKINRKLYMAEETDIINAKLLLKKGKLISVRPHTRFIDFPPHTHDYIEVVYMCLGSSVHTVNGKQILLSEGELLFLSRRATHSIKKSGEKDIAVNFIILPEFFENSLAILEDDTSPLKKFILDSLYLDKGPDYLHFKVANELCIQNLVENLIWTINNDVKNKRMVNRATMELLFLQLLNHTDSLYYDNPEDEAVVKVLKYADENYKNGSLCDVANMLHYDVSWLSREIKRKTGVNYTDIIQAKRLSQAAFYLKNTSFKISDISLMVGYDNVSYFYRLFNAKYGQSPKRFRDCK